MSSCRRGKFAVRGLVQQLVNIEVADVAPRVEPNVVAKSFRTEWTPRTTMTSSGVMCWGKIIATVPSRELESSVSLVTESKDRTMGKIG